MLFRSRQAWNYPRLTFSGSVAEFVGNRCGDGGLTAGGTMSFSLGPWLAEASEKANTRSGNWPEPGGMQSLQSMDGPVLRLHSCRALSPEPQAEPTTGACSVEGRGRWKKGWSSIIRSVLRPIEPINQEDQPCSWKLRRF